MSICAHKPTKNGDTLSLNTEQQFDNKDIFPGNSHSFSEIYQQDKETLYELCSVHNQTSFHFLCILGECHSINQGVYFLEHRENCFFINSML